MLLNPYLHEARNKSTQLVIQKKVFQNCALRDYPECHSCLSHIKFPAIYQIQGVELTQPALPKQLHISRCICYLPGLIADVKILNRHNGGENE